MQVRVTFRHTDSTDALKKYASEKVEKVSRLLIKPTSADVVLTVEKFRHRAEVIVHALGGSVIKGVEESDDMYAAIDLVVSKLERQAKKIKDKVKREWHRHIDVRLRVMTPSMETEATGPDNRITESELLAAPPLSVEEALGELITRNLDFLVYTNRSSNEVNTVYRRDDGFFGNIQPVVDDADGHLIPFRFDVLAVDEGAGGTPSKSRTIRSKQMPVQQMSVERAIDAIIEGRNQFWVFADEQDQHVNVVYKLRKRGGFALIEAYASAS